MSTLFITFGCSWTEGVGSTYYPEMKNEEYQLQCWDSTKNVINAYRTVLSTKYNLVNLNFSEGGSSNQKQFRLAKEFFGSTEFLQLKNDHQTIIVLHAITSTARNELYSVNQKTLVNRHYAQPEADDPLFPTVLKYSYDHDNEVKQLTMEILFWNSYYKSLGIKNVWVDTFNHHAYNKHIPNLIAEDKDPRDLLSMLCFKNGMQSPDTKYHKSNWKIDSNRISYLMMRGVVNPYSYHPTKEAHIQIADYLSPSIEALLT
tara:strand:+ start:6 stop:782 length:777 start_codon:yes stop_codon:yes gene_type:complete